MMPPSYRSEDPLPRRRAYLSIPLGRLLLDELAEERIGLDELSDALVAIDRSVLRRIITFH